MILRGGALKPLLRSCAAPTLRPAISPAIATCTCRWSSSSTSPVLGQLRPHLSKVRRDLPLTFFSSRTPPFTTARPLPSASFFTSFHRPLSTAAIPAATFAPAGNAPSPEPIIPSPVVARYLFLIAGMVFAIVIVGGMTRLTESGLSITEWNVVSGTIPPITQADWEIEFEKYRQSPEFRLQNSHITLSEFKRIFYWEYSHRLLGRVIGLTFLLPIPYFVMRRHLSPQQATRLLGLGTLIGAQGALGWYMVKSGLDDKSITELGGVARVSQYRLAAHLGLAFAVYAASLRWAISMSRDWKLLKKGQGLGGVKGIAESLRVLESSTAGRVRAIVTALTGLVFLTALSGAFVAGLDAGLVYNEFPLMGGRLHPPKSELFADQYSRNPDKSDKWWRNLFENPTTVQFDHRVLATTTFTSIVALFAYARRPQIRSVLPPTTYRLIKGSLHMSILQVALGISTLIYLVPTHLAATHQAGSLVLLSLILAAGASLRRPGRTVKSLLAAAPRRGV